MTVVWDCEARPEGSTPAWEGEGSVDEGTFGVPQARAKTNQLVSLLTGGHLSLSRERTKEVFSHTQCAWKEEGNLPSSGRMSF